MNEQQKEQRLKELEQMAYMHMSGEDIANELEVINPQLRKEYNKLMYDWVD